VRLLEAHEELGGRARSNEGPFKANLGPHALYQDGPLWQWLAERNLLPGARLTGAPWRERREVPLGGRGAAHAAAGRDSLGAAPARSRGARRPRLSRLGGQSHRRAHGGAAVGGRRRLHVSPRPGRAVGGVRVVANGAPVSRPPAGPRPLCKRRLGDAGRDARAPGARARRECRDRPARGGVARGAGDRRHRARAGGCTAGRGVVELAERHTVCLDLGLRSRRGDPWIVSDMEQAGWIGRYSTSDRRSRPLGTI
jgi:hypothetical protein